MYFQSVPNSQQYAATPQAVQKGLGWQLPEHRAVSFKSPAAGQLRVLRGRVWATADGPHSGPLNDWGDVVLSRGEAWAVQAGQRIVLEPWAAQQGEPVLLGWEPTDSSGDQA